MDNYASDLCLSVDSSDQVVPSMTCSKPHSLCKDQKPFPSSTQMIMRKEEVGEDDGQLTWERRLQVLPMWPFGKIEPTPNGSNPGDLSMGCMERDIL